MNFMYILLFLLSTFLLSVAVSTLCEIPTTIQHMNLASSTTLSSNTCLLW